MNWTKPNTFNWNRWIIWFFPACAAVLVAYLIYDHFQSRGPLVTIELSEAMNLRPKETKLKYRGVDVGDVEDITLDTTSKHVLVKARLYKDAAGLAREGTRFWVVYPRIGFDGVSGLETIMGGSYIKLAPGDGVPKFRFKGIESQENLAETAGRIKYFLKTSSADEIDIGSPITFRGVKVGEVTRFTFGEDVRYVNIEIEVEKRYVVFIKENSIFWRTKGLTAELDLFNPKVEIGSLQTLMRGGISFDAPNGKGNIANADSTFQLNEVPPNWYANKTNPNIHQEKIRTFTLKTSYADDINIDDPVFFRGVKVGQIKGIKFDQHARQVLIDIGIKDLYAQFVRINSVFWKRKAIKADLSLLNSSIEMSSFEAFVKGGIYFATPDPALEKASSQTSFVLQEQAPLRWREWSPEL